MCWLGELERRARDAVGNVPAAHAPISQPAKPQSKPDIKAVPVQTAAPFGGYHGWLLLGARRRCGNARRGRNTDREASARQVANSAFNLACKILCRTGNSILVHRGLSCFPWRAGEDPRSVAYRLTRESWQAKTPDYYPNVGVA
jgi:hypothetical protein